MHGSVQAWDLRPIPSSSAVAWFAGDASPTGHGIVGARRGDGRRRRGGSGAFLRADGVSHHPGPAPVPSLDGENVVFGRVLSGLETVTRVAARPRSNRRATPSVNQVAEWVGDDRAAKRGRVGASPRKPSSSRARERCRDTMKASPSRGRARAQPRIDPSIPLQRETILRSARPMTPRSAVPRPRPRPSLTLP